MKDAPITMPPITEESLPLSIEQQILKSQNKTNEILERIEGLLAYWPRQTPSAPVGEQPKPRFDSISPPISELPQRAAQKVKKL